MCEIKKKRKNNRKGEERNKDITNQRLKLIEMAED